MVHPKKNKVQLSDTDVKIIKDILKNKDISQTIVSCCRILLALDENHPPVQTYDQCMDLFYVSRTTISNVTKTFVGDGLDAVLKLKRNINSDNARRKVDGRTEARIVEIACGSVPEGHARWTIRQK